MEGAGGVKIERSSFERELVWSLGSSIGAAPGQKLVMYPLAGRASCRGPSRGCCWVGAEVEAREALAQSFKISECRCLVFTAHDWERLRQGIKC